MQTAVPAGTAVFRGKWKRTDSRFAAFGGRGELRSPFSAPKCPLRDIPVFRMAYFTIKPYYGLISKTLMLQVRSAHPPMPHRNVFSKHPGVPLGLFGKPKRSSFSRVRGLRWAGGGFAPPRTPLSRRPPDTGRTVSKAPLEGSWRAAPEGWVRHGDAQFRGIEERRFRFRLRLTGLHAFCRRQRLWNQSVWPSRTCRAKALMSEKAGQSRPAPPASPSSCTSEPAVMSK